MKTFRFFSMAAVALMMGACSVEDNAVEEQAQEPANGRIRFEATIAAPDAGARTRTTYEATSDGTVTAVKWKENDQIALIHQGIKETVWVSAVDEGTGEATITGTITAPSGDEEDVLLVYPAASVDATGSGTGATYNATYALNGHTQDGTYGYISQYLDARRATGKIIKSGTKGTLKSSVKLVSEIAIWRLKLSDGTNPFPATKVTLKLGGVTIAGTKTLSTATNDIYLCVVPKTLTQIYDDATPAVPVFTIEATDGTNNYIYGTTSALSLATNTYYESPVTLAGPFTMAAAANDPTNDLGKVICTAGHIHANTSDDATCPATRVAMIAFVGSETGEGTIGYNHGLALAMSDANGGSTCKWSTSETKVHTYNPSSDSFASESGLQYNASHNTDDYPAFQAAIANNGTAAPTGCSAWFLPTGYQWNKMITACTNKLGTNNNHRDLRYAFFSRGGNDMGGGYYWSSTEYDAANAWMFDFGSGGNWLNYSKTSIWHVRSVLAF